MAKNSQLSANSFPYPIFSQNIISNGSAVIHGEEGMGLRPYYKVHFFNVPQFSIFHFELGPE
jgi:hypothetical protein